MSDAGGPLAAIAQATRTRYSERLRSLGPVVRALGWGSDEQQRLRFAQVCAALPLQGRSVVDIGCGFGDLLQFLRESGADIASYTGLDLNPELLQVARERHAGLPGVHFDAIDVLQQSAATPCADVGVMLGVLNFNLGERYDNFEYTRRALTHAFSWVREALVVDFLSAQRDPAYPRETQVYYHEPARVLEFALTLTPKLRLYHDYPSIPQREFFVVLLKDAGLV